MFNLRKLNLKMTYKVLDNCIIFNHKQKSKEWFDFRKKLITASNLGKICGDAPYYKGTPENLARELLGIKEVKFDELSTLRMEKGNHYEDLVRQELSKDLKKPIIELGLAVWRKDDRFGASVDGVIIESDGTYNTGIEIKCPARMYRPIKDKIEFPNTYTDDSFVWKSHLYQMLLNAVILGLDKMIYVVYAYEDKILFTHEIDVKSHMKMFNEYLYPTCCKFYDTFMMPLMKEHGIQKFHIEKYLEH